MITDVTVTNPLLSSHHQEVNSDRLCSSQRYRTHSKMQSLYIWALQPVTPPLTSLGDNGQVTHITSQNLSLLSFKMEIATECPLGSHSEG